MRESPRKGGNGETPSKEGLASPFRKNTSFARETIEKGITEKDRTPKKKR